MPPVSVNYLAVAAAAIVSIVIGFVWYSMPVFGKPWMKMLGLREEDLKKSQKEMGPKYGLMVVASLVMAYVLSHFVDFAQATTITGGFSTGFWIWLGFVATIGLNSFIFESKPFNLYLINVGYYFASLLAMGAILAVWA